MKTGADDEMLCRVADVLIYNKGFAQCSRLASQLLTDSRSMSWEAPQAWSVSSVLLVAGFGGCT